MISKVQLKSYQENTGELIGNIYPLTNSECVELSDGNTLQSFINTQFTELLNEVKTLRELVNELSGNNNLSINGGGFDDLTVGKTYDFGLFTDDQTTNKIYDYGTF